MSDWLKFPFWQDAAPHSWQHRHKEMTLFIYSYGTFQLKLPQKAQRSWEELLCTLELISTECWAFLSIMECLTPSFATTSFGTPLGVSLKSHPALGVLSLEGACAVVCSIPWKSKLHFYRLNTQKSWLIQSWGETGVKRKFSFLFVYLPGSWCVTKCPY